MAGGGSVTGQPYPSFSVMVVDDEPIIIDSVRALLKSAGVTNVTGVHDSTAALDVLERGDVGVVLLDLTMPGLSGEELIPLFRHHAPDLPIVVITGNREVEKAVECMKAGVDDYLTKPMEGAKLVATVRRFIEIQELRLENKALAGGFLCPELERPEAFAEIVTADDSMRSLMRYVEAIGRTRHPVLVTGETGTGKEMIARAVHKVSGRAGEFVPVNTAGLDDTMFSDALFGHRAGAYTGATESRGGLAESALGGTLFLDEIGDLGQASQVKLLRLIESGEYYPLGSDMLKKAEARIVVATNIDLQKALKSGAFRMDLFYRLSTHRVHLPPLRARSGDIPLLARHFAEDASLELGRKTPVLSAQLLSLLQSHDYPGNVRELRSIVYDAVSRSEKETLSAQEFPSLFGSPHDSRERGVRGDLEATKLGTIRETVELLIRQALEKSQGNRIVAARILGITPQALGQRLKRMGIG
jgi:DNA-binding NtrC family response regulator